MPMVGRPSVTAYSSKSFAILIIWGYTEGQVNQLKGMVDLTSVCTIVIPYAIYHNDIVRNAVESAKAQTVKCYVECYPSEYTPAGLRNRQGIDALSPFVVFLDADDTIAPTFIEDCLRAYEPGHYVYTAWNEGSRVMRPRDCNPYGLTHDFEDGRGLVGGYHLVTTLYPTAAFRALGGFDESLPGMEDTDFYMRSARLGICGIYLDKPLLNYSGAGQRSKAFKKHPDYETIVRQIYDRDGGLAAMAGCCGVTGGAPAENLTGEQPGDVKAQTLYTPSTQYGRATGRYYARQLYQGQIISVSPLDVQLAPELWKEVIDPKTLTPDKQQVLKEAGIL